ncbi:hypothetical protein SLS56_003590 [Neofusicoccum ribis]|uniref:Ubiquitin 3 binding protein But2 C-terminal domain-containing protein n=1 Tax=Neofusicoccum ribis TaxID=45134 RepID=A0ABR3SYW1_9PEZI
MKTAAVAFGLALGANAAPRPSYNPGECCFSINAWGAIGTGKGFLGQVKQLPDGQLRIGQTNLKNPSRFCLDRYSYGLKDQNGFGCILAGSVKQFQCDHGKPSWAGWDVLCDGQVAIRGDKTFSMCPTGDFGGYNIYTRPIPFQGGCIDIILTADQGQCRATCNPQPPKRLPFPHLIVPVNKNKPDHAPGTSLFGTCSKTTVTYFNFDIPAHYQGKQCTLQFMFPQKSQLETSNFNLQGSGTVGGSWTKPVNDSTNYNNRPEITKNKIFHFQPGKNYVLDKVDCQIGVMTYALGGGPDTYLHWFQDFNPCPIGLYITAQ